MCLCGWLQNWVRRKKIANKPLFLLPSLFNFIKIYVVQVEINDWSKMSIIISGVSTIIGKLFASPIDFLSGKHCRWIFFFFFFLPLTLCVCVCVYERENERDVLLIVSPWWCLLHMFMCFNLLHAWAFTYVPKLEYTYSKKKIKERQECLPFMVYWTSNEYLIAILITFEFMTKSLWSQHVLRFINYSNIELQWVVVNLKCILHYRTEGMNTYDINIIHNTN